jgi:hypothetical protein
MLTALEELWRRLQADVPGLPPIRPVVSPTRARPDHGPQRWTREEDGAVTGFVLTVDVLQAGSEAVIEATLHDAAHLLNWIRDLQDTTTRGVYHNQNYLVAAEEVGLIWPDGAQRTAGRGYYNPVLGDVARARHRDDVAALDAAISATLPHMELPKSASAARTDRLTLRCSCVPARSFRISRTVEAQGQIICGVCGEPFTEK